MLKLQEMIAVSSELSDVAKIAGGGFYGVDLK